MDLKAKFMAVYHMALTRAESMNDEGMIDQAIAIAVGLIVLVAVFSIAAVIGSSIDTAISIPAGSSWNATENSDLVTGLDIWQTNSSMLALAVLITILSLVIYTIMRLRGRPGGD